MRFSLANTLGNRDTSTLRDGRIVNGFSEVDGDIARAIKRPGLTLRYSLAVGHATAPNDVLGQGLHGWVTPEGTWTLLGIRGDSLTRPVV